jgi:hypothetical protein
VRLTHWTPKLYEPLEILNAIAAPATAAQAKARTPTVGNNPLLRIQPARYVEVLLGVQIPRSRKIHCPFHDDSTPSLHVHPVPEQGWACFGCETPAGRPLGPLGGDIYTLASQLWQSPAQGSDFHTLRRRLQTTFNTSQEKRDPE